MDVFKILGTIAIDNAAANEAIDDTTDRAENSQGRIGGAFEKIGSAAVKLGKTIAVGLVAGSVAITGLAKQAISQYADYEQLVDGVKTLFGSEYESVEEYAEKMGLSLEEASESFEQYQNRQKNVLSNASNAYKTAGLSANEYMETVTGFAAALNSSLGKNAANSAEYADMAIRDMSDNANKMGSTMESIQNAYAGFSKQNFTMLDNLKLGYGGTKEEMARLLEDAEKLNGLELGSYDINNFSDIVDAIHTVQTELGITDTTANEASSTISGSLSMVKASWKNLLTAFTASDVDVGEQVSELIKNIQVAGDNLIPAIENTIKGISEGIEKAAPEITKLLSDLLQSTLPGIVSAASTLMTIFITAIVSAIPDLLKTIKDIIPDVLSAVGTVFNAVIDALPGLMNLMIESLPGLIEMLMTGLQSVIPKLLDTLTKMLPTIVSGITQVAVKIAAELPKIVKSIMEKIPQLVKTLVETIKENLPVLLEGAVQLIEELVSSLPEIITPIVEMLPEIVQSLAETLTECMPILIEGIVTLNKTLALSLPSIITPILESLPQIIGILVACLSENFPMILEGVLQVILTLINCLPQIINPIVENLPRILSTVIDALIKNLPILIQGCIQVVTLLVKAMPEIIMSLLEVMPVILESCLKAIEEAFPLLLEGVLTLLATLGEEILKKFHDMWEGIKGTFDNVKDFFEDVWEKIKEPFSQLKEWFEKKFTEAWEAVKGVFSKGGKIFDGIKEGIADTFKTIVNGLINGINKVVSVPFKAINNMLNSIRNVGVAGVHPFKGLWGKNPISVPEIPQLYEGTVLEKGQVGLLEGKGAEAVIPLHNNKKWTAKVAEDMMEALGGAGLTRTETAEKMLHKLDMLIALMQKVLSMNIMLDTGVLVGELAPVMDTELGILSEYKGRGN